MKLIGCLFMLFIVLILFVLIAGWKIISTLLGLKGGPSVFFKTVKNVHQNVKNMQEQMKQTPPHGQAQTNTKNQSEDRYYNETSQQRTDTTSPGARKIIPDDEGEYVSYEEIKEKE